MAEYFTDSVQADPGFPSFPETALEAKVLRILWVLFSGFPVRSAYFSRIYAIWREVIRSPFLTKIYSSLSIALNHDPCGKIPNLL
jgi:hypothetical protein